MIDESRYEMRLALVLNGGVSLAVWMGGVTAEIDRMRRAAYPALMHGGGDPVLRRWEHLLERLRVRLVVDVIAGASAGGLNGAVLAAAIARGQPLPELRNVWRSVGSIENLAGSQDQRPGVDRLSVLNGDLLTASIADVFDGLTNRADSSSAPGSLRERLEQEAALPRGVTLFTTATSLRGKGEDFTDSTNQRFTQVEYRVLCRFRRPLVGDDEFNDDHANWRLTRAARASASFPAAFEPTFFRAGKQVVGDQSEAEQVRMKKTASIAASRWMIDGGVLDNEPFAPVLDRIARRPITRDVDRIVAYIDPEDGSAPKGNDDITKPPGMIETVWAALNLPRETNLLNQLARLDQMEREVEVDGVSDEKLLKRAFRGELDAAFRALKPIYRRRTDSALVHEIRLAVQSGRSLDDPAVPIDHLPRPDAARAPDGSWHASVSAAERVLRIALHRTRSAAGNYPNSNEISDALFAISESLMQLSQLKIEVLKAVVEPVKKKSAFVLTDDDILRRWRAALTPQRRALIAVLVANGLRPFVKADVWPKDTWPPGRKPRQRRRAFVAACEKIEVVRRAAAPISAYHPVPAFRFCRFGANVGTPFFSDGAPIRGKLMGLRLGHFGGFLKTEWRDYDWMWGRLDGATHLVMMLLDRLQSKPALPVVQLRRDLHAWVGVGYTDALDAALDAFLAAPAPPATPGHVITGVTLELVRPLHRAIFCSELHLDPATGLECGTQYTGQAPSLCDIDGRITERLEKLTKEVTGVDVAAMADSEDGRAVIGELGAAGLRALGEDPALPARAKLRPVFRGLADVVLAVTQRGPWRWVAVGVYILLIAALVVVPIALNVWSSGVAVEIATAVCGALLGLVLAGAILVLPARAAALVKRLTGFARLGPAKSVIEHGVEKLP